MCSRPLELSICRGNEVPLKDLYKATCGNRRNGTAWNEPWEEPFRQLTADAAAPKSITKSSRRLYLSILKNTKHPVQKVWTRSRVVSTQGVCGRFALPACPSPGFKASRDSGKLFQQFSRDFPGIFLRIPRTDPGNSHGLLDFPDSKKEKNT